MRETLKRIRVLEKQLDNARKVAARIRRESERLTRDVELPSAAVARQEPQPPVRRKLRR